MDETLSTAGYNTATVFLNGWRLRYTSKDHHIVGLSTGIVDIDHNQNQLRWKAGGILSDEKGDDEFTWCYYYTALLWNSGHLFDAIPYDTDNGAELTFLAPESTNRYIEENFSLDLHPGALLPRGFGLLRSDFRNDQHLNSFALDYSQNLFYTDAADGGYTVWQFNTRFHDRLGDDPYIATEVVSILEGDSVELLEPDFDIIPGGPNGSPGTGYHDVVSQTIVEENLPFDYAVPMLTGWDIGLNSNGDSHIKEIGAWIASFTYDKDTGTLTYTIESAFHDKHKDGGTFGQNRGAGTPRYKVSILGFNHLESIQNPRFEDNPAKPDTIDGGFELPSSTNDIPVQPGTVKLDPFPTPASTETQPQSQIR